MKNSDRVNHFVNTVNAGYARRSVYNTTNKIASAYPIKDKKRTGRPNSWTTTDRKKKLKKLVNTRKRVSQARLSKKISVTQQDISFQLSKKGINNYKREKNT